MDEELEKEDFEHKSIKIGRNEIEMDLIINLPNLFGYGLKGMNNGDLLMYNRYKG